MASSELPALDVNPAAYGAQAAASSLANMSALSQYQAQQQTTPDEVAALNASNKQKSQLAQFDTSNSALAQVAKDAAAADPENAPSVWDEGMKKAAAAGAPNASQYVGHYRPELASRVAQTYGEVAPQTAPNAPDPGALDMAFAKAPLEQVQQSAKNLGMAISSFNNVKDKDSWDAEIQTLRESGIPVDKMLPNTDWNPLNYAAAHRLVQDLQPFADAANRALARNAAGISAPMVPNKVENVGGNLVAVDPYGTSATPIYTAPKFQFEDSSKTMGAPGVFNPNTGKFDASGGSAGPDQFAAFATRMNPTENATGNPGAKNSRSTATGNGQFLDGTWQDLVKSEKPAWAVGMDQKQILAMRNVPAISQQMTADYARQNAPILASAGAPVTTASLALAHRLGPQDALKVMGAAPGTPLTQILSAKVIAANPDMAKATAGSYTQGLVSKVGNDPVSASASSTKFGKFNAPVEVEVGDGKGGTKQLLAQQNSQTGQWVTADQNRSPIDSTDMKIIPASAAAGGGGRFAGQVIRIMTSAKQATNELGNLINLPISTNTGWFGGRVQGPSLTAATKEALTNTVTSQEVQDFNTSIIGMGRALASLESGGMATNQALVNKFDGLALKEGDTNLTKMRKLATMRQDAEGAIDSVLTSPLLGRDQKTFAQGLITTMRQAVPWTPNDVTKLESSNNPQSTLGDFAKDIHLGRTAPARTATDKQGAVYTEGTDGKWRDKLGREYKP